MTEKYNNLHIYFAILVLYKYTERGLFMGNTSIKYNDCTLWQRLCVAMTNVGVTAFFLLFNFVSYVAVGNYGILVSVASIIITGSRIFDGVTDPIIGWVIDRTDTRFGRYRPMLLLGYLVSTAAVVLMFFLCLGGNIFIFVALYALYVIGYTLMDVANGGIFTCLTNNPSHRQSVGRWRGILTQLLGVGFSFYMSNYLAKKHRGINIGALQELAITAIILTGICVTLTIIAMRKKDVRENYKNAGTNQTKFKDMLKLLKESKNFRLVIIAIISDRLAQNTAGNSAIAVMIWGIVVGNYAFSGRLNMITAIPMVLLILFGSQIAMKQGSRDVTIKFSVFNICMSGLVASFFLFGNPTRIGSNLIYTLVFLVVYCLYVGGRGVTNSVTIPMLSDVADAEFNRTGKYMPSMVFSVYTFIDKVVSSLSATFVGLILSLIGYVGTMPQPEDPYSNVILYVGVAVWLGFPALGWLCSIIAMKMYDLTAEKMKQIQAENAERKMNKVL